MRASSVGSVVHAVGQNASLFVDERIVHEVELLQRHIA